MCLPSVRAAVRRVQVPLQDLDKVGGRLLAYHRRWRHVGDSVTRQWVKQGVSLNLNAVPAHSQPVDSAIRLRSDAVRHAACASTVQSYLTKSIIEPVPLAERGQGLYQIFFPVAKKQPGQWRGCLDARPINEELPYEHFKMEGLHTVKSLLRRDDYLTSLDISDAYPHLSITPSDRQYLRFIWEGVHYQFQAVCFGLASAPRIFTKLLRPIVQILRAKGIRCAIYLDDLILISRSQEQSLIQTQFAVDLLVHLGFLISPKSEVEPSRIRDFLGMTIDTHKMELRVPSGKVKAFLDSVKRTLRAQAESRLTLRQLAGVIGKISAMTPAVLPARLLSRELLFDKNRALAKSFNKKQAWDAKVDLRPAALSELEQWLVILRSWNGLSIIPPNRAREVLTTDASHFGWGGWWRNLDCRGFWTRREAARSNNARELMATVLSVQSLKKHFEGKTLEIRTDNMTTMAYINHQGGRNRLLTEIVRPLWDWALRTKTTIFSTFIAGKVNERADRLSRVQRDRSDWMLNKKLFLRLDQKWGPFTMDMFATRLNTQLPRFCSWLPDPAATAVDAFLQDLRKERAYANPPFNLIAKFLSQLKRQRAMCVLIVPAWPSQPWWPLLGEMLIESPILLPARNDLFLPGHLGNEMPMGRPRWPAIAVRVSGAHSATKAFQNKWRKTSSANGEASRRRDTNRTGSAGSIFVPHVGLVPFVPLR